MKFIRTAAAKKGAARMMLYRCASEPLEPRVVLSAGSELSALTAGDFGGAGSGVSPLHADETEYSGGVTVTDTEIRTETEIIPRFAANPTVTAVRSGNWSDASTWSGGHVPTAGDRVVIGESTVVQYNTVSNARIEAIEVSGTLNFSTTLNTRLTVGTLTVMPTGTLQIGTSASPVAVGITAELVIADQALNTTVDPRQYGTGLIGLGKVDIHGAPLNETWTRLAIEPTAGASVLLLPAPDPTWQPGMTLVLPDTRQVLDSQVPQFDAGQVAGQWETATIDRVVGKFVYLTQPAAVQSFGRSRRRRRAATDAARRRVDPQRDRALRKPVGHARPCVHDGACRRRYRVCPVSGFGAHRCLTQLGQYNVRCRGKRDPYRHQPGRPLCPAPPPPDGTGESDQHRLPVSRWSEIRWSAPKNGPWPSTIPASG